MDVAAYPMDVGANSDLYDEPLPRNVGVLAFVPANRADSAADAGDDLSPHEIAVLGDINEQVPRYQSLPELIDYIFSATRKLWPTNRLSVAFLDESRRRLISHYAKTDYPDLCLKPGYAEDFAGASLDRVIRGGESRFINDLVGYVGARPESRSTRLILKEGLRSSMTCPLFVAGEVVGVMFHSARRVNAYNERMLRLNRAITNRISHAVASAYRIQQLTEANRVYSELLGFVSHELKNPVHALMLSGQALMQGAVGTLTADQRALVARMMSQGEYLLSLVREYLDLARIESGSLRLSLQSDVDFIADVVQPALNVLQPQHRVRQMRVVENFDPALPTIECDPTLMEIVMVNLVSNAIKYGNEEGEIQVTVTGEKDALAVTVWNAGPGFQLEERYKLFRRFSRLGGRELRRQPGAGIGLYACSRIVDLHGGRIDAVSEPGRWAEFSFLLPQPIPRIEEATEEEADVVRRPR